MDENEEHMMMTCEHFKVANDHRFLKLLKVSPKGPLEGFIHRFDLH
jgi:hypothetical protein